VRAILFIALFLLLAASAHAATFNCAMRTSCIAGETLFLTVNSSESGQVPNNSHAYLANDTAVGPYAICCSTDGFRTLTNSCVSGSTRILGLQDTNNSHVQIGTNTSYPWSACLNVTFGTISCAYPNSACAAGYTSMASIASSEFVDNTSNAHIADPNFYLRKVCCQIGGQNPPVIAYVNISPNMTATTRTDLECQNGTVTDADGDNVTLHYNWYRNGTSITLLNLPMDYNGSHTQDISGHARHGVLRNNTMLTPLGGKIGTGMNFSGAVTEDYIELPSGGGLNNLQSGTISLWVKWTGTQDAGAGSSYGPITGRQSNGQFSNSIIALNNTDPSIGRIIWRPYTFNGNAVISAVAAGDGVWRHIVIVYSSGNHSLYIDGALDATGTTAGTVTNNASVPLTIGAWGSGYSTSTIDEVIVFNRSLSASEIKTIYNGHNRFFNSTELRRTEWWNCSITPIDSTGLNGSTKYSNRTNITGSIPLNATLYYPVQNNQSVFERFANFSWTAADERDGDAVTYTLNLTVTPGTCSVATTQSNIATTNYTFGELCTDQLYNWTINSCDIDGCSNPSSISNFTIASVVGIQLTTNLTELGTFNRNQTKATDADNIAPFIVNNTGNVRVNITLNATNEPFTSISMPSVNYQFKAGINTTAAFNTTGSQIIYTPFDTIYKELIKQLNYTAGSRANSTARIDVNITAPIDEPPGQKQGNFTIKAVAS
jgi:hypothetical protein